MLRPLRGSTAARVSKLETSLRLSDASLPGARIKRGKVAKIEGESSERRERDQCDDGDPGDELKRVDEGQRVGLRPNGPANEADGTAGGSRQPGRLAKQSCGDESKRMV